MRCRLVQKLCTTDTFGTLSFLVQGLNLELSELGKDIVVLAFDHRGARDRSSHSPSPSH